MDALPLHEVKEKFNIIQDPLALLYLRYVFEVKGILC